VNEPETLLGSRRRFLAVAATGLTAVVPAAFVALADKKKDEEDVSPTEDLMREHGLLNRILLVYDEGIRRLDAGTELPLDAIAGAAGIVKRFVEDYHEKLEEEQLFPRFHKAGKLVPLVETLKVQHAAGRKVTLEIQRLTKGDAAKAAGAKKELSSQLARFVRMYRPHEAREDTVLFPAFRELVKGKELDELGERFESKEHELFGEKGFERMVDEVAAIERKLGIEDLAQFTPK
jgi:hemerythrin-like domain-containing protein